MRKIVTGHIVYVHVIATCISPACAHACFRLYHRVLCTVIPVPVGSCVGVWFVGFFVRQSMMSIVVFVILLRLLVARAINARVESPPRLVLLTGRR